MASLDLSEFFEGLAAVSITANIDSNTSADEMGSGELNRASYGTRLWEGTVQLAVSKHGVADAVAAKIQHLQDADVTFRVTPGHLVRETRATCLLKDIDANDRRTVVLSEALADGAIFDIEFGSGKRSMHRVVAEIAAAPSFGADAVQYTITPPAPFGAAVDDVVGHGRPECNAVLMAPTFGAYKAGLADGATFNWKQTY